MSGRERTSVRTTRRGRRMAGGCLLAMGIIGLQACGSTAPEPEPVVAVRTTPAKRGPIALTISAEAVVSPLEQAVITPKITSTIKKFYVQRGSKVKEGQ